LLDSNIITVGCK